MSSTGANILFRLGLIVAGLTVGLAIGYGYGFTRAAASTNYDSHDHEDHQKNHAPSHAHTEDDHEHPHDAAEDTHAVKEHEEDVLLLSPEAVENLELTIGPATISDYTRDLLIPGRVAETPGRSDISVAAPVGGVVTDVMVTPGQAVLPDTVLFALRVTDEELINAQLKLLEIVARQNVIQRELRRLKPLTDNGIVTGKRSRELAYESDQLAADKNNRFQELKMRGMSPSEVESIVSHSTMLQRITITSRELANITKVANDISNSHTLTVESLNVSPGDSVKRGDLLCRLADHQALQIEGQAFETDIEALLKLKENGWGITAEFGHKQQRDHSHRHAETGLTISHINSRVDPETQTFRFYVPIKNTVIEETTTDSGQRYQTWRFLPGQQVHLRVPIDSWDNQLKVPLDAVVQDGAEWFIYRQHIHGTPNPADPIEVEPVPVRVVYRDDRFAILSPHGRLRPNTLIAQNNAYQLHQAFKMKSSGGGGHHHGHEH